MNRMFVTLTLAGVVFLIPTPGHAWQGTPSVDNLGNIRLAASGSVDQTLLVGQPTELQLVVSYQDMPTSTNLYVLLIPTDGDRGLVGTGSFSVGPPVRLNVCGGFTSGGANPYAFPEISFPILKRVTMGDLLTMFGAAAGDLSDDTKGEELEFTFAFVSSFGRGGGGTTQGSVRFTPPRLQKYYDGVVAVPFFEWPNESGTRCLAFDTDHMAPIRMSLQPEMARPVDAPRPPEPDISTGPVRIVAVRPVGAELTLGSQNTIEITVEYARLPLASDLYVAMYPVVGDAIVRADGARLTLGGDMNFRSCNLKAETKYFRVPDENRPFHVDELPSLLVFEGALVGSVPEGGSGTITGLLRLTPPPFSTSYDAVRLFPVVAWFAPDGRQCVKHEGGLMPRTTIGIAGRRDR